MLVVHANYRQCYAKNTMLKSAILEGALLENTMLKDSVLEGTLLENTMLEIII